MRRSALFIRRAQNRGASELLNATVLVNYLATPHLFARSFWPAVVSFDMNSHEFMCSNTMYPIATFKLFETVIEIIDLSSLRMTCKFQVEDLVLMIFQPFLPTMKSNNDRALICLTICVNIWIIESFNLWTFDQTVIKACDLQIQGTFSNSNIQMVHLKWRFPSSTEGSEAWSSVIDVKLAWD